MERSVYFADARNAIFGHRYCRNDRSRMATAQRGSWLGVGSNELPSVAICNIHRAYYDDTLERRLGRCVYLFSVLGEDETVFARHRAV